MLSLIICIQIQNSISLLVSCDRKITNWRVETNCMNNIIKKCWFVEKAKLTICLRYRIISFPFDTKHYQLLQYLYYPGKDFKLTAALFRSKSHIIQSNRSSLWGNCNTFFKYIVYFLSHRRPEGFKVPFFFIYYNSWKKEVKKIQIDDLRDILSHWCLRPFDEVLFWDPEALELMI